MRSVLLLLIFAVSCASNKPSPYQKEKKNEGYTDAAVDDLHIASFHANTHTKKYKTQTYAEFRAIETCLAQNKHANIIDIIDKTIQKDVIRTSGSGWGPSYGVGMYPYYSRYSTVGIGVSYNSMYSSSWSETLTYPAIDVYYTCADKVARPELIIKEISAENMKLLVKDLKGALQIERVAETSPNKKAIEAGDLIVKADGKRIEKVHELIKLFHDANSVVDVQIMREGEKRTAKLKARDITDEALKTEQQIIAYVCKDKKKEYQPNLKKHNLCH